MIDANFKPIKALPVLIKEKKIHDIITGFGLKGVIILIKFPLNVFIFDFFR